MDNETLINALQDSDWQAAYLQAIELGVENPEEEATRVIENLSESFASVGAEDEVEASV